jgi:hypothetical protein
MTHLAVHSGRLLGWLPIEAEVPEDKETYSARQRARCVPLQYRETIGAAHTERAHSTLTFHFTLSKNTIKVKTNKSDK